MVLKVDIKFKIYYLKNIYIFLSKKIEINQFFYYVKFILFIY